MKSVLLFFLFTIIFAGCRNDGGHKSAEKGKQIVQIATGESFNFKPITLLNLRGINHLFYEVSDGNDSSGGNIVRHSVSTDLINWSDSEKMNFPGSDSKFIKGGFVIDSINSSGYGSHGTPVLVAMLMCSEDNISQKDIKFIPVLTYSTDEGNSWKIAKDSINFPRVFVSNPQNITIVWNKESGKWITTIALNDHVEFYSSSDLHSWSFESSLGSDFFPGEIKWQRTALFSFGNDSHWVLLVDVQKSGKFESEGGTTYFVGDFDGHEFINKSAQLHWLDYGEDIYGSLVSVDHSGRIINICWGNPKMGQSKELDRPVSGITTIPRELNFREINSEWFIVALPASEFRKLYDKEIKLPSVKVSYKVHDMTLVSDLTSPMEIVLSFNTGNIQKGSFPTRFGISFWNDRDEHLIFGFDRFGYYYVDKSALRPSAGKQADEGVIKMPYIHEDSTMNLRFIVDDSKVECFAEGGRSVMTSAHFSAGTFKKLKLFAVNGNIELIEGKIITLKTGMEK